MGMKVKTCEVCSIRRDIELNLAYAQAASGLASVSNKVVATQWKPCCALIRKTDCDVFQILAQISSVLRPPFSSIDSFKALAVYAPNAFNTVHGPVQCPTGPGLLHDYFTADFNRQALGPLRRGALSFEQLVSFENYSCIENWNGK
jgi:hypothetical protein